VRLKQRAPEEIFLNYIFNQRRNANERRRNVATTKIFGGMIRLIGIGAKIVAALAIDDCRG
jgi:hypothetical protein